MLGGSSYRARGEGLCEAAVGCGVVGGCEGFRQVCWEILVVWADAGGDGRVMWLECPPANGAVGTKRLRYTELHCWSMFVRD